MWAESLEIDKKDNSDLSTYIILYKILTNIKTTFSAFSQMFSPELFRLILY